MAGENDNFRDMILNTGAIDVISQLLDKSEPQSAFQKNTSWALSNLTRGKPCPPAKQVLPAIAPLAKTLLINDQ